MNHVAGLQAGLDGGVRGPRRHAPSARRRRMRIRDRPQELRLAVNS
jgi:hypothetical protein